MTEQRLFIDCTQTYVLGGSTGIQRVLRQIVLHRSVLYEFGMTPVPVVWNGTAFAAIPLDLPANGIITFRLARFLFRQARQLSQRFGRRRTQAAAIDPSSVAEPAHASRMGSDRWFWFLLRLAPRVRFLPQVSPTTGDMLFLADASWYSPEMITFASRLRAETGCSVGVLVFDLLPITHPQYVQDHSAYRFRTWIALVTQASDFAVCISQHVFAEFKAYAATADRADIALATFRLGADLDSAIEAQDSSRDKGHFLMVGTVEPRKGHSTVLDAFDVLWEAGHDVTLHLIGRYGWLAEGVAARIESHPEFGTRLHWYRSADDKTLSQRYSRAQAIISASFAEGFGLPIVEAGLFGAPVIATDIPAHREIGLPGCEFFDAGDHQQLAGLVTKLFTAPVHQPDRFEWPTWSQSVRELGATLQKYLPKREVEA